MSELQETVDATFKLLAIKMAEKDKPKKLWAVCAERCVRPGVWIPDIMHMHAHDKFSALAQYYASRPQGIRIKVVGVAPVVGYFVNDNNGEISA